MRLLRIGLGLLVAALFLFLLFRQVPFDEALRALGAVGAGTLFVGSALILAAYLVRALRWKLLLSGAGIETPYSAAALTFFSSFALNNVLPLRAGDIYRWVESSRQHGGTLPKALAALMVERVLDLTALVALFLLLSIVAPPTGMKHLNALVAGFAGAALLVLATVLAAPRTMRRIVRSLRLDTRPASAIRWLAERALATTEAIEQILALRTMRLALLTLAGWMLELLVFIVVARAFGAPSTFLGGLSAGLFGTLATLIPGAPGHVGTFDYFAALGFRAGGIAQVPAVSAAVASHLLVVLPVTAIGGVGLLLRNRITFGTP